MVNGSTNALESNVVGVDSNNDIQLVLFSVNNVCVDNISIASDRNSADFTHDRRGFLLAIEQKLQRQEE